MTSTITLYRNCKIIPSKNFIVDSLEDYLSTLDRVSISNFQYIRNDLHCYIKISKDQDFVGSYSYYNYNYLKVSQDGVSYYYFIVKKTQLSQNTIGYELLMDTLNTYKWGTAFNVSARTRVRREHKERFNKYYKEVYFSVVSITDLVGLLTEGEYTGNIELLNGEFLSAKLKYLSYSGHEFELIFDNPFSAIRFQQYTESSSGSSFYFKTLDDTHRVLLQGYTFQRATYKHYRNIDYYNEGLSPVLYKKELGLLRDKKNDTAWDLVYKNANDSEHSAIDCLAIPEENTKFIIPADSTLELSDFEDGKYYIFAPWNLESYSIVDNNNNSYFIGFDLEGGGNYRMYCVGIRRSGTRLYISSIYYSTYFQYGPTMNGPVWVYPGSRVIVNEREITSAEFTMETIYYLRGDSYYNPPYNISERLPEYNGSFSSSDDTTYDLKILSEVDRVDPKLVKIISIPYFPTNYTFEDNEMSSISDAWTFNVSDKTIQLNDLDVNFSANIETNLDNPLNVFKVNLTPYKTDLRNDFNESKLFHSDFYQPKFVYDSFGFVFDLEKMDAVKYIQTQEDKFNFEFIMTATINSKFLFRFPQYELRMSTSDYDNVLPVARNNERPIYHSNYITYLRTAYRYDLKEKYQNTMLLGVKTGLGLGDTLFNSTSNSSEMSAIWSGLTGVATNFLKCISTLNNYEWNLQAKVDSLKAQANSVSGSDDLDLMEAYASNRAKLVLYEVSPRMKEMLADLFYYFGYTTEEFKIPSINTRIWFNFLSCEIEFTGIDYNIKEEIKEDIAKRFNDGATFLHMNEIDSVKTWDFDQIRENWESSLFE